MQDPYKVLGISANADLATAKSAYRRLALKYHPDRNNGSKESEERFKAINEAWSYIEGHIQRKTQGTVWVHNSLFSISKKGW